MISELATSFNRAASTALDSLTGLSNRGTFMSVLEEHLRLPRLAGFSPLLFLIDIKRFKSVNDGYGIETGDLVLLRVAKRLQALEHDDVFCGRMNGDTFGLFISSHADPMAFAKQISDFISRPYAVDGNVISIGLAIGSASASDRVIGGTSLVRAADIALYQAKAAKSKHVHFHSSMEALVKKRSNIERDLRIAVLQGDVRRALSLDNFELYYQPQVNLRTGHLTGFEALLRWHHPERGYVNPLDFIPIAEEIGLINLLGDWVLRTACLQASVWGPTATGAFPRVSVNVSPLQLTQATAFAKSVREALTAAGLQASRLELEITESALIEANIAALAEISEMGVALALDDFGTGYSSLSQLSNHPFSRLKIDRSFVPTDQLLAPQHSRPPTIRTDPAWMMRAIAALGAGLGMETVIEGVETEEQRRLAASAGCTEMQGYLVSKPMPVEDLSNFISSFRVDWVSLHQEK